MNNLRISIQDIVSKIDQDLQLETDFKLSERQKFKLALNRKVTISNAVFKPFAQRAHDYLALCNEDNRYWGCFQDLSTLDYTIVILNV